MNKAIISLGSNNDSDRNIKLCRKLLNEIFELIYFSHTSTTKPFGKQYKNDFLNQLALARTDQDIEDVKFNLKLLEKQLGRNKDDKEKGLVKIDIDIVKWNDIILKNEDWNRSYVADLLPSLYNNTIDF